ncbi:signal peptide peptidase SppA [Candidatus Woesearchaeota archaeon]|nr:signal peptide peptidase SppA [Candidatus Woesearchaeota archaeon]
MPILKQPEQQRSPWLVIILVIFLLTSFSIFVLGFVTILFASGSTAAGNVAVIPIKGVIMIDDDSSLFSSSGIASSTKIVKQIEDAEKDPSIQAIVLDINSPGGSPVASAEIARAIKEVNKTTVAVIREVGASGAYWAASAADHIIANEVSVTGSIGVLGSYVEYGGLMERYNVSYQRFVAGDYKDMGTPYQEMSEEEKQLYQSELDKMHDIFIRSVAENRGMSYDAIKELATGQIYLGVDAIQNGLIDQLGGKKEAYAYLESNKGITVEPVEYETEKSFLQQLASAMDQTAFRVGTGIGAVLVKSDNAGIRT